eukprot:TRINITY_DN4485_c5_g1_i1.p1 TRINITY_DN4485_c5_g1~~TRINITY_DN4485_c5_g1_i1.p1  ORF type:complete len:897 (+),score=292.66 TRINITY_DN4485_c5_g1_i1:79-2691(+)
MSAAGRLWRDGLRGAAPGAAPPPQLRSQQSPRRQAPITPSVRGASVTPPRSPPPRSASAPAGVRAHGATRGVPAHMRVAVRVKPPAPEGGTPPAGTPAHPDLTGFDVVFDGAQQCDVHQRIGAGLCGESFEGYNCCVFAYGSSGSGKTFTIQGLPGAGLPAKAPHDREREGLLPRIMRQLLSDRAQRLAKDTSLQVEIRLSLLEIYNERIRDLLNPASASTDLRIVEDPVTKETSVRELLRPQIDDPDRALKLIRDANKLREVGATGLNAQSSRSHLVAQFEIRQSHMPDNGQRLCSRVTVVDLAGSETSESAGRTRHGETRAIGCSLLTLGSALNSFSQGKSTADARGLLRRSKLTWLLKEAFGGNCKTWMLATINPGDTVQTNHTLGYARRAKDIKLTARQNADQGREPAEVAALRRRVTDLQEQVDELTTKYDEAREHQQHTDVQLSMAMARCDRLQRHTDGSGVAQQLADAKDVEGQYRSEQEELRRTADSLRAEAAVQQQELHAAEAALKLALIDAANSKTARETAERDAELLRAEAASAAAQLDELGDENWRLRQQCLKLEEALRTAQEDTQRQCARADAAEKLTKELQEILAGRDGRGEEAHARLSAAECDLRLGEARSEQRKRFAAEQAAVYAEAQGSHAQLLAERLESLAVLALGAETQRRRTAAQRNEDAIGKMEKDLARMTRRMDDWREKAQKARAELSKLMKSRTSQEGEGDSRALPPAKRRRGAAPLRPKLPQRPSGISTQLGGRLRSSSPAARIPSGVGSRAVSVASSPQQPVAAVDDEELAFDVALWVETDPPPLGAPAAAAAMPPPPAPTMQQRQQQERLAVAAAGEQGRGRSPQPQRRRRLRPATPLGAYRAQ